jgi:hypothetical protein
MSNQMNNVEAIYENQAKNLIPNLIKVNGDFAIHQRTSKFDQDFQSDDSQNAYNNSKLPKVLILSYFRSGSSFLGDLLTVNSDTFYLFEPFYYIFSEFGKHEITNDETINLINPIFKCEYKKLINYINWFEKRPAFLAKSKNFWNKCTKNKLCSNSDFFGKICRESISHVIKVARLRMKNLEVILPELNDLNIHIIYLVRDPRGILNSRTQLQWGEDSAKFQNITYICEEIRDDLFYFHKFQTDHPERFTIIRFEDLANDPLSNAKMLYQRTGFNFTPEVSKFISENTNISSSDQRNNDIFNTARNSRTIPNKWMKTLDKNIIKESLINCKDILKELKYFYSDQYSINESI